MLYKPRIKKNIGFKKTQHHAVNDLKPKTIIHSYLHFTVYWLIVFKGEKACTFDAVFF
jgi:hypothetical protein